MYYPTHKTATLILHFQKQTKNRMSPNLTIQYLERISIMKKIHIIIFQNYLMFWISLIII